MQQAGSKTRRLAGFVLRSGEEHCLRRDHAETRCLKSKTCVRLRVQFVHLSCGTIGAIARMCGFAEEVAGISVYGKCRQDQTLQLLRPM